MFGMFSFVMWFDFLKEFSKRVLGNFCLAHLLTFSPLQDALGLAYMARSGDVGGVCSGCICMYFVSVTFIIMKNTKYTLLIIIRINYTFWRCGKD